MSSRVSDAARRAAEAARRAAEARRRAAEAAAKKAAQEAAKRAAEAAAKQAAKQSAAAKARAAEKEAGAALAARVGNKPLASAMRQSFGKDEVSKGLGRALRERATRSLAMGGPAPSAPTPGRTTSLTELRALQARGGPLPGAAAFRGTPDSLERNAAAREAAATPKPPTVEQRAAEDARTVQSAWDAARSAGRSDAEAANAASQKLRELTQASSDPAYRNHLVRAAQPTLDEVATVLGQNAANRGFTDGADKDAVKHAVRALSDTAAAAGEVGALFIGDRLARQLPDSKELMHVDDGFYEHLDAGGSPLLMQALGTQLDVHGKGSAREKLFDRNKGFFESALDFAGDLAGGLINGVGGAIGGFVGFVGDVGNGVLEVAGKAGNLAVDVAKGTVELAGNAAEWTKDQVVEAAQYAAENGLKLAGEALNWVGDHARELAAEALDIDGQLAKLNSPGDSVTIGVGGTLGLTVLQGSAEVEMKVTKTADGYEMTLSGEVGGGVFGGLSLPGFPSAQGEANATGIATATMKFATLEDATKAAETVGGIGIASALGGPAGALLTGATAGDEVRFIGEHFHKGSVGLELSASAKAELGETAGLGFGASVKGTVTTGARLEIEKGKPPALVLDQSVQASGTLALGGPVPIPALGGELNGGSLDGSATISAQTRVPLPDGLTPADVMRDPVGSAKRLGSTALEQSTTKLSLGVDIRAGLATKGLLPNLSAAGGLEISLSAEAKTRDLAGALGKALTGDLAGALNDLGTKTELDLEVSSYEKTGLSIDEKVSVPGFTIGVKAENSLRDETELWSFNGTPAELAQRGFDLFDQLRLNVG